MVARFICLEASVVKSSLNGSPLGCRSSRRRSRGNQRFDLDLPGGKSDDEQ